MVQGPGMIWRPRVLTVIFAIAFFADVTPVSAEDFRFAVLCDSRAHAEAKTCSKGVSAVLKVMVQDIVARSESAGIKLVLFPGDLILGLWKKNRESVAECNRAALEEWRKTMQPLVDNGMKVRVTAGNHEAGVALITGVRQDKCKKNDDEEMNPASGGGEMKRTFRAKSSRVCGGYSHQYLPKRENFEVFRTVLAEMLEPGADPGLGMGLTYSFDQGPCHFAVLNAYTMFENNSFSNGALQWLDCDLGDARERGKLLFVASHPPAFPGSKHMRDSLPFFDPDYSCENYSGIDRRKERDRFWNILKKHNVVAYFCGHEHNMQVQRVKGVWQVVAGGVTEKLKPLNGAPEDPRPNTILYNGLLQNPRASVIWPWNQTKKAYWGWCMVSVSAETNRTTMQVFGSAERPKEPEDLSLLKTFVLRGHRRKASPGGK